MSPPVGSSPSFASAPLPQRTGTGQDGQTPSLRALAARENAKLSGVTPLGKETLKHKTDDYSEYWAALGYDA